MTEKQEDTSLREALALLQSRIAFQSSPVYL